MGIFFNHQVQLLNMKRSSFSILLFLSIVALVMVSGCAQVTPVETCVVGEPYGFFSGLWHGIIAPVSFILSLFMDNIAMYAVNNTGGWYDFGFVLGAGILFGGGGRSSR